MDAQRFQFRQIEAHMSEPCLASPASDIQAAFLDALQVARRAPSGNNVQPWRLLVLRPEDAEMLIAEVVRTAPSSEIESAGEEIDRLRSPLAALCLIDQRLGQGSSLDYGMFLENLRLAAAARGVHIGVLHVWSAFSEIVGRLTPLPDHHRVLCALAMCPAGDTADGRRPTLIDIHWLE